MTDFGKDVSCTTGLRTGRYATGARLVGEAAFRRLSTPRGTLRGGDDEANYGLDLAEAIGSATTAATAAALPGQIEAELLKDERITSVDAQVTVTSNGPAQSWQVSISADTDVGPFTLVLAVSGVTVSLLGLQAAG